jgi:hypothetical protein
MRRAVLLVALAACHPPGESGPYVKSVLPYAGGLAVTRCTLILDGGGIREGNCSTKVVPLPPALETGRKIGER